MKSKYDPKNPVCQACCTAVMRDNEKKEWCEIVRYNGIPIKFPLQCRIEEIKSQIENLNGYPDKMQSTKEIDLKKIEKQSNLIEQYTVGYCRDCKKEYNISRDYLIQCEVLEDEAECNICGQMYEIRIYYKMRNHDKEK